MRLYRSAGFLKKQTANFLLILWNGEFTRQAIR
jgi:hypothetical protein